MGQRKGVGFKQVCGAFYGRFVFHDQLQVTRAKLAAAHDGDGNGFAGRQDIDAEDVITPVSRFGLRATKVRLGLSGVVHKDDYEIIGKGLEGHAVLHGRHLHQRSR